MLAQLPPELILLIVSFLTRVDPLNSRLTVVSPEPALVPDLPSVNALSRANTVFHHTLDQVLYGLCASVPTRGKLALQFAVEHQLERTFDKLVAAGIGVGFASGLLHIAAIQGLRAMVIKLLGMYGEEMAARVVHARDNFHSTVLDYAARARHMDIVQLLAPIPMPSSDVAITPQVSDGIETRERYLSTALLESAEIGHLEISKYLILEGADVNFLGHHFLGTPLCYAIGSKNLELIQLLLASGADPNRCHNNGTLPLFRAATVRSVDIAQALLAADANLHTRDDKSRNVLFYCIHDIEILRFFLECGADPNHRDRAGVTPLRHMLNRPSTELRKPFVELLLQFGAVTTDSRNGR
ncbi:ankyrin repeat-containing domain protein [Mycena haematopus]|nr:ankyrin repeat-containing domain protein [Mycena haematopus]